VLGSPISGRTHADLENQIGLYLNMLVLRTSVSGDESVADLLKAVRETTLGAYEHQSYPFSSLVRDLNPERSARRATLINAGLTLQNHNQHNSAHVERSGLELPYFPQAIKTSEYDLWFLFSESHGRITADINYSTDLFEAETVARLWGRLTRLLGQAAADPDLRITDLELSEGPSAAPTQADIPIELNF
jgi:non-ribosomal peptide synthetase component F